MISSKNFSSSELSCPCCGQDAVEAKAVTLGEAQYFLAKLEELRYILSKPMPINSAYRCKLHNAEVGGVSNSEHTTGMAVDIQVDSAYDLTKLVMGAINLGFTGIGIKKRMVHLDMRKAPLVIFGY